MSTGSMDAAAGLSWQTAGGARLLRLARGGESDPAWARPLLWLIALMAGSLTLWGLTRSGYANTYYAQAAQAASHSWKAWLMNAIDTSGSVSLDKGPLANMLMGLSGRLLGFSSFSMLLPQALCGIGSVLLVHNAVKRTLGHRAALLAALMLALTPIFVAMSRFNNPDALLVLLEVASAWALLRALQSGRTSHVLLAGALIGLAFNVKMLQAYLIVPGLACALALAGRGGLRRRAIQLLAGGAAMLTVSFAWYGAMMLIPAADRPWVGDTTDNSWFSLIFGANGLNRVSGNGPGPAGGFAGAPGPLRLFNPIVGGQIAWLLPLAAAGLTLGLLSAHRRPREDLRRAAYVLWGGWALVSFIVFSFAEGVFHPYYTDALAPAVAVLAAGGAVESWDRARHSGVWTALLALMLAASAALALLLLGRTPGFAPFLGPVVIALAAIACALLAVGWALRHSSTSARTALLWLAAVAASSTLLAGPAAYSLQTVGKRLSGGNPLAGPESADASLRGVGGRPVGRLGLWWRRGEALRRFGGAAPPLPPGVGAAGRPLGGPPPGVPAGRPPAGMFGRFGGPPRLGSARVGPPPFAGEQAVSKSLIDYLRAHQGGATYLVAAVGSSTSASIALQAGRNVVNMGGFMGADPAPSLAKLRSLISAGELRYVLLSEAVQRRPPGSGSSSALAAIDARDTWVRSHGQRVEVPAAHLAGSGLTLYYFAK